VKNISENGEKRNNENENIVIIANDKVASISASAHQRKPIQPEVKSNENDND